MAWTRTPGARRLLALLAALALLSSACGAGDDAAGGGEQQTQAEEPPSEAADETEPTGTEPTDSEAPETVTLPVVQSVDSLTFLPVYAALTQGFYEEEGLDVQITLGGVGGREVQALLGGEVDVAFSAGTELAKVASQGRDAIAVQAMGNQSAFAAMIRPEIAQEEGLDDSWTLEQRLELLEGRTVGISSPGALSDTIARYWIEQAGLSEADVQIVATGPPAGGLAALQQGAVDILMSWSPFAEQIEAQGIGEVWIDARRGADPSLSPWLEQTIVTTPQFAQENPDVVRRLVQATTRGNQWVLESEVSDIVDMVLSLEQFAALDPAVVTPAVEVMQQSFTADGTVEPAQLENIERVLTVGGVISSDISVEEHFDNSYLEGG